jgi:N-carbamoyl-L-amino-acid hydrolase
MSVVAGMRQAGFVPGRDITVMAIRAEEGGAWFNGFPGSRGALGSFPPENLAILRPDTGLSLEHHMRELGFDPDALRAGRKHILPETVKAYVELHIEQGPVLEAEGIEIGAVADLQGISWQRFTITGQSNHAGTTPMRLRRDAGHCAAAIAVFVRALALRFGGSQVGTVGSLSLHPNLVNVIAAHATLTVDLRNTDEALLAQAEAELAAFVQALAAEHGVTIEKRHLARLAPVRFDAGLVQQIEARAQARGWRTRRMTSGAGHDAQMLARMGPAAMVFVPSVAGISHNPREHTAPADLLRGATLLRDVLLALAGRG